jgi:hypothetical protein
MYVLSIIVCPFVLFFSPLCCLFFFDIRFLIAPLVSSNSSDSEPNNLCSYKNTNFDKEDILAKHKSFKSSLNIPIHEENCELTTLYYIIVGTLYWIPKCQKNQYLDRYIPGSSTCSTKELSITVTKILHAVKGGLLSYCDKVYSHG